jgi:hypothetical protein
LFKTSDQRRKAKLFILISSKSGYCWRVWRLLSCCPANIRQGSIRLQILLFLTICSQKQSAFSYHKGDMQNSIFEYFLVTLISILLDARKSTGLGLIAMCGIARHGSHSAFGATCTGHGNYFVGRWPGHSRLKFGLVCRRSALACSFFFKFLHIQICLTIKCVWLRASH